MRRKKNHARKNVNLQVLPVVHPNAAGIDVGAKEHLVAVPCDRDPQPGANLPSLYSRPSPISGLVKALWNRNRRTGMSSVILSAKQV
jgi:hypothetical protein